MMGRARLPLPSLAIIVLFLAAFPSAAAAAEWDRRAADSGSPRHGVQGEPYIFGQIGVFDPPRGASAYLAGGAGARVSPNFAFEGSLSTYEAKGHGDEARVWPFLVGVRFLLPDKAIEPYAGVAGGFFLTDLNHSVHVQAGTGTAIGAALTLGVEAWLSPKAALNAELRHHMASPEIHGHSVDVDGTSLSFDAMVNF